MTVEEAKARIDHLKLEINGHNHKYYVLNEPAISDYEFDMMLRELEDLSENIRSFKMNFHRLAGLEVI